MSKVAWLILFWWVAALHTVAASLNKWEWIPWHWRDHLLGAYLLAVFISALVVLLVDALHRAEHLDDHDDEYHGT